MNLGDIAKKIGGTVVGDASLEITDVRSIETAEEGHITFATEKRFFDNVLHKCNEFYHRHKIHIKK